MTAKSRIEKAVPPMPDVTRPNGPSIDSAEPRAWLTEEDAHGWRVRFRGKDAPRGGSPRALKQSVMVELDDDEIAWLDRRAVEGGVTLAGAVKQLIDQARAG